MIRTIEEMSMNAWPSRETVLYDGWVLRFNDGYTRRANSINPLYPSTLDVKTKITYCKRLYTSRNLRPIYKITHQVNPLDLDEVLSDHEYRREAETSVQTLPITADIHETGHRVKISEVVDEQWIRRFMSMNQMPDDNFRVIASMLHRIATPKCFASIIREGEIIACGIGVIENHAVGLFDIVVDPHLRKQGLGTQLVFGILDWARSQRVTSAYLQVMIDNAPAMAMYAKMGFSEVYRYWYRVG
ncbi:MAG: GNAT family N-acetyltransferase [candidate division WOR-3 bacterium]|nr:MAG: GNAT family N-acetyltransferase [candidate division WOR-3 bacterium]